MFNFKIRIMINSFINYFSRKKRINFVLAKFDTQDNLVMFTWNHAWFQNVDLGDFTPLQKFGLWRFTNDKVWVKCQEKANKVRLNKFNFPYKVKKINDNYFEIQSKDLQKYFDNTDIIEVLFELK